MTNEESLLKHRGFRWLWAGQTISEVGSQLTGLAFPVLAVTLLQATEFEMGLLNTANTAAFLVFGLLAGAWIDRWRKRRVMLVADIIRMALHFLVPALWFSGHLEMWHLIVIASVGGIATTFFDISYQSYVPILVPDHHVGTANSRLETTNQLAGLGGPAIVGFLLHWLKAPALLIADAFSFLFSAFALSRIQDSEVPMPKEDRRPLKTEISEGVQFVWRQKLIRTISFCTASSNLMSNVGHVLFPIFVLRTLGLEPGVFGLLMSVGAVGGLLGATTTARLIKIMGEGPLIALSAVVMGVSAMLAPLSGMLDPIFAPYLLGASGFIGAFTVLTYNITQVTARQRLCPPELLGRMNASIRFFVWGVMPIGSFIGGVLGTYIGIVPTMWIGAIGSFLAAGFVVFSPLSRMKELPRTVTEAAPTND